MALAIVQATANTQGASPGTPTTPTATFGSPCANGNLIVVLAMTFAAQGAAAGGSGFTLDSSATSGVTGMNIGLYYAYLGAGGLTVLPFDGTNRQYWACAAWELSGSTGVWASDKVAVTFNAAAALYPSTGPYTTGSFNTAGNSELVLGAITANSGASNAALASSAYTTDATDVSAGSAFCSALGLHVSAPTSGTAISTTVSWTGGGGTNSEYAFVELLSTSGDVTGSGPIGNIALSAPIGEGQASATGSGSIGTINFSAPAGTGVISTTGSGPIGTINMTPPAGIGTSSVVATGSIGTITFTPPYMTFARLTQYTQQALAINTVAARLTQFGLDTLGKNSVNARATFMSLLVLARGGEPPLQPNPLSLHDGGREPVLRLRFVNMYPEQTPQGPGTEARYQRAGLYSAAQYGGGPIQALQHWVGPDPGAEEFLITISGGSVYRDNVNIGVIDPFLDPTWFPRGKRIHCARSETQFMACSNGKLYSIDLNSVTQVATTGILPAGVRDIAFLGGRFLYILDDDSGEFFYSDIGDGTTISGLSLATASEDDPFPLIAAWDLADDIYFFTSETTEIWYVSADPANPYQRSQGRRYNKGLLAQDSVELIDNSLFWLGHDRQIYRSGAIPVRVSNFDIEDRIRRLTDQEVKQCYSFGATIGGHNLYVIHLMSQGSWAYDIPSRTWAEWQSYNKDRFRAFCSDDTFRLFGDYYLGHLMGMDGDQHRDFDGVGGFDPIERVVSAFYPLKKGRHVNFNVILMATRGVGGRVEMRWSDHEGHDWSPWLTANLGGIGERGEEAKAVWSMLGGMSPPGRLYEFRCTDDCFFAPYQLRVDEERP